MAQTIVSSPFTDNRMTLTVSHTSHGFDANDIGKAVRSSGTDGQFVVARANSAANAEVVGVITSIDTANQYTITTSGFVDVVAAVPTATAGTVFFLAEADDSQLTSTEPTTVGAVSKPVAVITESNAKMILIHYRGEVLTSTTQTNAPNDATYVTTTSNSSLSNEVLTSALKIDDFAAGDDNTDLDSSTSRHGLLPKLGGGSTNFLRADGTWNAPSTAAHGASSHTNIAKSLFIPSMGAHIAQGFTVVNGGRHHALRAADGADCRGTFTMRVPDDFVSFTSIKMLWQTPATSGNLVFLCYFHWAGVGEADSTNAETGNQQTVATGGAEVFVLSEMGDIALSGLAAKDFLGSEFRCYRNNGSDTLNNHVDVFGWEFNYVASQ